MEITNDKLYEAFDKLVNDSIGHAVELIDKLVTDENLDVYDRKNQGIIYKKLHGKVNIDAQLITTILKNWIFMKDKYLGFK